MSSQTSVLAARSHAMLLEFLQLELDLSHTFLRIAASRKAAGKEHARQFKTALTGVKTVLHFLNTYPSHLPVLERRKLRTKISEIRSMAAAI
jgi:hypothetical protein